MTKAPARAPRADRTLQDLVDRALELQSGTELLGLRDICRILGLGRDARFLLGRATEHYWRHGLTSWPPVASVVRRPAATDAADLPCLTDWPYYATVLPPPDVRDPADPRWLAGTFRHWAMMTGRMGLDGTVLAARPGKVVPRPVDRRHPDITGFDPARWHELVTDPTLWTLERLAAETGYAPPSDRAQIEHLYRTARGMRAGGIVWPPSRDDSRRAGRARDARGRIRDATAGCTLLADWPWHHRVLPPPHAVVIDNNGRERWMWTAGTVRRWAMVIGRMGLDGTVPAVNFQGVSEG